MQLVQGFFNGTGVDVYLCLGSVPEKIVLWNIDAATPITLEWSKAMMHDTLTCEGIYRAADGGAVQDLAFGEGVSPYYGGDLLTTSNQTSVTYGEGIYLEADNTDYKHYGTSGGGIAGDASTVTIDTWTLDTAATPTGHFNGDVVGTYIGPGSLIRIQPTTRKYVVEAVITALTGGQGVSSNEVTLSWAAPSGTVEFIGGKHGYKPMAVGKVTKAGVLINNATLNANDKKIAFSAWCAG